MTLTQTKLPFSTVPRNRASHTEDNSNQSSTKKNLSLKDSRKKNKKRNYSSDDEYFENGAENVDYISDDLVFSDQYQTDTVNEFDFMTGDQDDFNNEITKKPSRKSSRNTNALSSQVVDTHLDYELEGPSGQQSQPQSHDIITTIISIVCALNKGKKVEKTSFIIDISGFEFSISPQRKKDLEKGFKEKYSEFCRHWTSLHCHCSGGLKSGEAMQKFSTILGFPEMKMDGHHKTGSLLTFMRFLYAISFIPLEIALAYANRAEPQTIQESNGPILNDLWKRLMLLIGNEKRNQILSLFSISMPENATAEDAAEAIQLTIQKVGGQKRTNSMKESSRKRRRITPGHNTLCHQIFRDIESRDIQIIDWKDEIYKIESNSQDQFPASVLSKFTVTPPKNLQLFIQDPANPLQSVCITQNFCHGDAITIPMMTPQENGDYIKVARAGGHVNSLDWLPEEENTQILYFALSIFSDPSTKLSKEMLQLSSSGKYSPIEVWSVQSSNYAMQLKYRIHHEKSFAWCAKWMPQIYTFPQFSWERYQEMIGVLACAFNDGSILVFGVPKDIDSSTDTCDIAINAPSSVVYRKQNEKCVFSTIEWTKDGKRIIAGDCFGSIVVLSCNFSESTPRLTPVMQISAHTNVITSLSTSEVNFNFFASSSLDGVVMVHNLIHPHEEIFYKKTFGWPTTVEFPPYSEALAINYQFKGISQFRYDFHGFSQIFPNTVDNPIWDLSYAPSGSCLALSTTAGAITIYPIYSDAHLMHGKKIFCGELMKSTHNAESGNYTLYFPNHVFPSNVSANVATPDYFSRIVFQPGNEAKASLVNMNRETQEKERARNLEFPAILPDKDGQIQHIAFHPSTKKSCRSILLASNHEGFLFLIQTPEKMQFKEPTPY